MSSFQEEFTDNYGFEGDSRMCHYCNRRIIEEKQSARALGEVLPLEALGKSVMVSGNKVQLHYEDIMLLGAGVLYWQLML